ncbi:MAG: hypothetical protein KGM44_04040, partial [bacterium]|nr:hypothetical protein [bacterium]
NQSDPAKGKAVDLLATRAAESALRARAIEALAPAADADPWQTALAYVLRGDQAAGQERWSEAIAEYHAALRASPDDFDALDGIMFATAEWGQDHRDRIDAAARLAALAPGSVDAQIDLGAAYQSAKAYPKAIAAARRANLLAMEAYRAKPSDPVRIRAVAATHLFWGRAYAAAGEQAQARAQFQQLLSWAHRIPPSNSRHAMYIEEGSEALAALNLGAPRRGISLTLAPWTGPELPGSVPGAIKYRLLMTGTPNSTMALRVGALPAGWIASFCTGRLCSPFRAQVSIPQGGVASIEFQVLRNDRPRPDRATVRIEASDGGAGTHATTVVDFTHES